MTFASVATHIPLHMRSTCASGNTSSDSIQSSIPMTPEPGTRDRVGRDLSLMHRFTAGFNPYNLFFLTIDYSKNFTTNKVLTIGHMSMFVVKSIVIQINGLA